MEDDLVRRAASIAEYTDTSVFIPERDENGEEAPPEWFGLSPDDGNDSAEVIDSSGEEEGEEEEGDEEEAPEAGADGQPQLDHAYSNEPRPTEPAAARGDQRRPTSRPPRQLALPTPPVLRVRPRLPRLPLYLCFYLLSSLNELVILHNSTHWVYLEPLFDDSAKGLFM